LAALRNKCLYR